MKTLEPLSVNSHERVPLNVTHSDSTSNVRNFTVTVNKIHVGRGHDQKASSSFMNRIDSNNRIRKQDEENQPFDSLNGVKDKDISSYLEKPKKIPRPPNSFIIFRSEQHIKIKRDQPNLPNTEISRIIGQMWHKLTHDQKKVYEIKAIEAKQEHAMKHPTWKFCPKRKRHRMKMINGFIKLKEESSSSYLTSTDMMTLMEMKYHPSRSTHIEEPMRLRSLSSISLPNRVVPHFSNKGEQQYPDYLLKTSSSSMTLSTPMKDHDDIQEKHLSPKNLKSIGTDTYYSHCFYNSHHSSYLSPELTEIMISNESTRSYGLNSIDEELDENSIHNQSRPPPSLNVSNGSCTTTTGNVFEEPEDSIKFSPSTTPLSQTSLFSDNRSPWRHKMKIPSFGVSPTAITQDMTHDLHSSPIPFALRSSPATLSFPLIDNHMMMTSSNFLIPSQISHSPLDFLSTSASRR